jgi:hypothetical protein
MNTQIDFLSDDALDAVSGGRPDLYQGGNKPPGYGTTPGGLQNTGDMGTGNNSIGPFAVSTTWAGMAIIYSIAAAAAA